MIVAFDFDGTASEPQIKDLILKLVKEKNEVWIVTMRKDNEFNRAKIAPVLKQIGLTMASVIFCNEKPKLEVLKMINADMYVDNISDEFSDINNHSNTVSLLFKTH